MSFPLPSNEQERLREYESLRVFESAPLPELQALCEVAAHVAKTPVALVSLVGEDEQRFAANVGLPGVTGTPREDAFCAHALMSRDPFVVSDASADARFCDNPLVTGSPGIRAYAGIPLETSFGCIVGTLCAIDFRRRSFSTRQIDELKRLAQAVARLLAGHRSQVELLQALTDRTAKEEKLRHAARHDPLTDLANLSHFRDLAETALRRLPAGQGAALLLIDLDRFKLVNDSYGHAFGDAYIRAAAVALKASVREGDHVGRLGGDEFAVFLSRLKRRDDAVTIAERIRSELRQTAEQLGRPELGCASIGIALAPDHAQTWGDLNKLADVALYATKAAGRDGHTVYHQDLGTVDDPMVRRAQLLTAVKGEEFVPFFQAKVDLASRRVIGFEVLCRWRRGGHGAEYLPPSEFSFAFDDVVVAPLLTRAIVKAALHEVRRWRSDGLDPGTLAFNATTADLQDATFVGDVLAMISAHGLSPHDVTIEVLETVVMGTRNDRVYESLRRFRLAGVKVALDDFGVGYGGLQHLRSWPIDGVKVDRSFVAECLQSEHDRTILRSIISLTRDLGLGVVVEGIETEEQAELLMEFGCPTGQGYLFTRPLPADAFAAHLRA